MNNIKRNKYFSFCLAGFLSVVIVSCSIFKGSSDSSSSSASESISSSQPSERSVSVGTDLTTLAHSAGNNSDTSLTINGTRAAEMAQSLAATLEKASSRDKINNLNAIIAAQQLSGASLSDIMSSSRSMMLEAMKSNVDVTMPEVAVLNMAIAAVKKKNYSLAENYLDEIVKTKNNKVKAGAHTLKGLINLIGNQIPEAAIEFQDALKADSSYRAARLNLGFIALRYGLYEEARKQLSSMQDDWFALSGLSISAFMLGDNNAARNFCSRAQRGNSKSKSIAYNCGVIEYYAQNNADSARRTLTNALKLQGSSRVDENIYKFLEKIERDQIEERRRSAVDKAKAAADSRRQAPPPTGTGAPKAAITPESTNQPQPAESQPAKAQSTPASSSSAPSKAPAAKSSPSAEDFDNFENIE